ncbi:MAG: hypothetical protein U0229_02845 [Anaeromyxobacter sp.]
MTALSLSLAALVALAPGARPAAVLRASPLEEGGPRRAAHRAGTADVVYLSATRAYLDAGAVDGLSLGEQVTFKRHAEVVGRCAIDQVGDHNASCPVAGLKKGDDAFFQAGAPAGGEVKTLEPLVEEDELARRAALVAAAAPLPQVVFRATGPRPAGPAARNAEVALSAWAWTSTGPGQDREAARVDVMLHGVPVGGRFTLDLDARAERWVPDSHGLGEGPATRIHVWQAQVNAPLSFATFSAGRLRSFGALGATVVDGVSARFETGPARLGLYAGALPAPDTLIPGTERVTAGGTWSIGKVFASGVQVATDGRLAFVKSPELGSRVEADLGARAWAKAVDVNAEARLGVGGLVSAPGKLDLARVDVTLHPLQSLLVGLGARHQALAWPDRLLEPSVYPGRGDAADGFVSFDAWRYLRLAVVGGTSRDTDSKLNRAWVGPELSALRLFGNRIDLVLGYLEERGWLDGRSAYTQVGWRAGDALRLTARATYSHESSLGLFQDEAGFSLGSAIAFNPHLGLRLAALARVPISGQSPPVGVAGNATLYANY